MGYAGEKSAKRFEEERRHAKKELFDAVENEKEFAREVEKAFNVILKMMDGMKATGTLTKNNFGNRKQLKVLAEGWHKLKKDGHVIMQPVLDQFDQAMKNCWEIIDQNDTYTQKDFDYVATTLQNAKVALVRSVGLLQQETSNEAMAIK